MQNSIVSVISFKLKLLNNRSIGIIIMKPILGRSKKSSKFPPAKNIVPVINRMLTRKREMIFTMIGLLEFKSKKERQGSEPYAQGESMDRVEFLHRHKRVIKADTLA